MRQKDSDEFIIETNRTCYDNLGKLYTDGQNDLDILIELGSWKELLGQLTGRNILNVGCGTADASVVLIENGFNIVNTDLSKKMVELAKSKCPQAKNLVLEATEIGQLEKDYFDGILAIHLIQHLSKGMMLNFFKNVHDLLTEDGVFYLVFTNTCYERTGCQLEGGPVENNRIYWHKWRIEDVAPLLAKAKLQPISVRNQKFVDKDGGYMEPFVFICKRSKR